MSKKPVIIGVALLAALATAIWYNSGPPDTSRSQMNPRKQAIYNYAASAVMVDTESSVLGSGSGPNHPLRLKEPYPTQAEMEAACGKADFSQMEPAPTLHSRNENEQYLTLYWWEKDSTWEVPIIKKKGYREIAIARFDKDGRLRMLEILDTLGFQEIGRYSTEWRWTGTR